MMSSQPKFLLACFLFCFLALAPAHAQAPTTADVETVMKGKWDKVGIPRITIAVST